MTKTKEPIGFITRVVKHMHGVTSTYYFEKDRYNLGPYKVEIEYPDYYVEPMDEAKKSNKGIPKTQQMYLNEATGKMVSYQRAKQIGIIK